MNVHFLHHSNLEKLNKNSIFRISILKYSSILFLMTLIIFSMIFMFVYFSNSVRYQLVCNHLSSEDSNIVIFNLLKKKIPYHYIINSGDLLVPEDKVNVVRLMLLSEGLPKKSNVGFEIFDKESFGTSPFISQINYKRALEGELENSIEGIQSVKSAKVNISFPTYSLFEQNNILPSASVIISVKNNKHLSFLQCTSIVKLIAASVPKLLPTNIVMLDDYGNYLNDNNNIINKTHKSKLHITNMKESYYYNRIKNILKPILQLCDFKIQVTLLNNINTAISFKNKSSYLYNKNVLTLQNIPNNINFKLNYNILDILCNTYYFVLHAQNKYVSNNYNAFHIHNHVLNKVLVSVLINFVKNNNGDFVPLDHNKIDMIKSLIANAIGNTNGYNGNIKIINIKFINMHHIQHTIFIIKIFKKYIYYILFSLFLLVLFIFIYCIKKIYMIFNIEKYKKIKIVLSKKQKNYVSTDTDRFDITKNIALKFKNDELIQHVTNISKNHPKLTSIIIKNWINNNK